MNALNRVILMGNLTRDPQLRKTQTGQPVCDLGLAVSEKFRNKAGELTEQVCFADLVVWGRQAEMCNQYLHKGRAVLVEGRLQFDQWTTDQGDKRSKLRVRADRITFIGKSGQPTQTEAEPAAEETVAAEPF